MTVQTPFAIHFTNMERSDEVEASVRTRVERVEKFFDEITSCHVFVDASHLRRRKGNRYEVRIEIRVPGTELAVNDRPGDVNAHDDVHVAIRDAFNAMERRLKKWKQQFRSPPKAREAPLQGRVAEIRPGEGHGQIATTDGRLVYFHQNSVITGGFDELKVGDPVELVVRSDESEKGPQASTVRPIGSMQFVDRAK
jgi:ribosomal subunit interface protein